MKNRRTLDVLLSFLTHSFLSQSLQTDTALVCQLLRDGNEGAQYIFIYLYYERKPVTFGCLFCNCGYVTQEG